MAFNPTDGYFFIEEFFYRQRLSEIGLNFNQDDYDDFDLKVFEYIGSQLILLKEERDKKNSYKKGM